MLMSVIVRPKPKKFSSVTTTPDFETALTIYLVSGSKHVITCQLESDGGQPLSGALYHTTNLLNFDHMTIDQLKHGKL